jgi:anti-sigma regulatory factor (Ser/Thr protein kinase)
MTHTMRLDFDADPLTMRMARKQVGAAARAVGADEYDAGRIELAVAEALANVYAHAYGRAAGPVGVEIAYEPGRLCVTVQDAGRRLGTPFEPRFPDPPDPRLGTGYGLYIIKELMDEAELAHAGPGGHGTAVRMGIRLT